ncbi:TolC family protein [bacterium]|nr:TolC family protein [bacterium]
MKKSLSLIIIFILLTLNNTDAIAQLNFSKQAFNIFDESVKPIKLSLEDAILKALNNNISLKIEKLDVQASKTAIESEKAAFDTKVKATVSTGEKKSQNLNGSNSQTNTTAEIEIERLLYSGTTVAVNTNLDRNASGNSDSLYSNRIGIDLTHPLLRNSGNEINLISLKQAELDYNYTKHELKAFILDFIASVEKKYWEHYLSVRQLEIVNESAALAIQQRQETNSRILAGSIPESERAAAEAEVAKCEEDLINAQSNMVNTAISLLRAVNHDTENFWKNLPNLTDKPFLKKIDQMDLEAHLALAEKQRPELLQAKVLIAKNELEIVTSKNGLLPKLDFFVSLGNTGYSRSFNNSNPKFNNNEKPDFEVGFDYELTRNRRSARAKLERSKITADMKKEALKNLEQVIKEDVIKAYIEVQRTMQQVAATAATTQKQQEKLRVEEIKFSVGKTTSFQVSQAQRDLTEAKIAEVKAAIAYTGAITELMRADGTSLLKVNKIELK